jgi:hypothetical protein
MGHLTWAIRGDPPAISGTATGLRGNALSHPIGQKSSLFLGQILWIDPTLNHCLQRYLMNIRGAWCVRHMSSDVLTDGQCFSLVTSIHIAFVWPGRGYPLKPWLHTQPVMGFDTWGVDRINCTNWYQSVRYRHRSWFTTRQTRGFLVGLPL